MTDSVLTPSAAAGLGASKVYELPVIDKYKKINEGDAALKAARGLHRSRSMIYAGVGAKRFTRSVALPFISVFFALKSALFKAGASDITLVATMASVLYAFLSGAYNSSVATGRFFCRAYYLAVLRATKRQLSRLNGMILIFAAVAIIISTSFISVSLEVFLDGSSIGYVRNQAEFENALGNVEAKASELLKRPYRIFPDVSYEFNIVDRRSLLDAQAVEAYLFDQIGELSYMYVLTVDGEQVGASADRAELDGVLSNILARYPINSDNERVGFLRDVRVSYQLAATDSLMDISKIESLLNSNIRDNEYYTVVSGDLYETIAARHGMSRSDLLSLNPGIDSSRLAVGQQLIVNNAVSFLPVVQTKTIVYEEAIPFETERVDNASMYKGDSKVITAGVNGTKQITAEVRYVDGEELDHSIISSTVLQEPVVRVLSVGTKTPPPTYPTGTYIRPASGIVTSGYGYRTIGRSSEFHTGVDFANSYGTPVKAIDGGTVSFAGWKGNYGYCVIIDHKNGIQSLYGHNSSLNVSVGQQVAQGTTIAKMGSTGRSTGNHCHLEIRVNGNHVNPWNYIK